MKRILFVYPNQGTELRIPLAISILISAIRKAGHIVKLFDTTFMGDFHTDNEAMEKLGTHLKTDLNVKGNKLVPLDELNKVIKDFKPDFICASLVERNFKTCKELLKDIDIPILIGGILPTIAPSFVLQEDWVDYICVGEGEEPVIDFLAHPDESVPNIWTINDYPYLRSLISLNDVPFQDWTDFDERHLLKPFMGKVYKGGAFEFSRGCGKSCTFCVAPQIRKTMAGCGKYHRTKAPQIAIGEIEQKVNQYGLNMISFGDTDFLQGVPKRDMIRFLQMYEERIGLPFTMQASVETLTDPVILEMLHTAHCCAISVGVESGSDRIRKSVIKKAIPIEIFNKAFDLCRRYNLRVTANYMVGLPYETEKDVLDTIKLNRLLNPPSIAVTFFTPFMGTELYDVCIKEDFYQPFQENVYEYPPLRMPQLSQERIVGLVKEFSDDFKSYQRDFNVC